MATVFCSSPFGFSTSHESSSSWSRNSSFTSISLPHCYPHILAHEKSDYLHVREMQPMFARCDYGNLASLPNCSCALMANSSREFDGDANLAAQVFGERRCHEPHEFSHIDCTAAPCDGPLELDEPVDEQTSLSSFASLLRRCGNLKSLLDGRRVHDYMIRRGYDCNTFLGNCLVQMYGNCGSINDARATFDQIFYPNLYSWSLLIRACVQNGDLDSARSLFGGMPQHDVVSWTALISAYAQNGHPKDALDLFDQMLLDDVKPNKITFVSLLDACATLALIRKGREIHAAIVDSGCEGDVVVGTALLTMYSKCGSLQNANRIFCRLAKRDVVSYSAMLTAFAENGCGREALDLLYKMRLDDIKPDKIVFICALYACSSLSVLEEGHKVNAATVDCGYDHFIFIGNALISMYGKCRSLHSAKVVFDRMPYRNVVSWTALISASVDNGRYKEGVDLFWQMQLDDIKPDKITFICTLDACAGLKALDMGKKVHSVIINAQYEGDICVGTALINMYGKCGSLHDARNVFNRIPKGATDSWNSMIAVCSQHGHGKEALLLLSQMQLQGVNPDKITFSCVLNACADLAALEEGQRIYAEVVDRGYEQDVFVGTAIINMYGECGSLDAAMTVFCRMPYRDVVSWNAMIVAYAQNGHGKEILELFNVMQADNIKPNKITFLCILAACSHTGQVKDARHLFISMKRVHGIAYSVEHYMCMIDLLGRAGHLQEAEDLICTIPSEYAAMAWLSLLGACQVHGDVERGGRAASQCFSLDPKNEAPYVILSNIYARAGSWDDVLTVGKALKSSDVIQLPEQSCEVNSDLHGFVIADMVESHREQIHGMLDRLMGR